MRVRAFEEIWGSHGGEDVNVGLLGCNAVWTCKHTPTFRRYITVSTFSPEEGDQHQLKALTMCCVCVCQHQSLLKIKKQRKTARKHLSIKPLQELIRNIEMGRK
jgi:hypothetical protein